MRHIPGGDGNSVHVSFGFPPLWIGVNLGLHKLWIALSSCWERGKTSPGWLEPMDLAVSEHVT